jgi:precorrin-6A/cobalt-precorrin-6A reductase
MDSQRVGAAVSAAIGSGRGMRKVLILGGTAEARRLAGRLAGRADLAVTLSLAGRTARPAAQPVPVRIGGFGGAEGLAAYLSGERIGALIDATHPYAAAMSANAAGGAAIAGVPLLALRRPPWLRAEGDRWTGVADVSEAVRELGAAPRHVFLALGRKELAPFVAARQHHYLIRSVDPVDPPLDVPHALYVTGRGPFTEDNDRTLLSRHDIDVVVCKNSGGAATYGKIAAARSLGIGVIILRRPILPDVAAVETVEDAVAWLDHGLVLPADRGV